MSGMVPDRPSREGEPNKALPPPLPAEVVPPPGEVTGPEGKTSEGGPPPLPIDPEASPAPRPEPVPAPAPAPEAAAPPPGARSRPSRQSPDTPPRVAFALRRCRPLNDPVGHWARILPWLILLQIPIIMAGFVAGFREIAGAPDSGWSYGLLLVVSLVVGVIFLVPGYLMVRPMLIHARKRKVLFLRAFSRDRSATGDRELRKSLRCAMPGHLSLAGIRPPDSRAGSVFRLLGDSLVALRYLGSNQFELEAADRNWLARLLASMGEAGAVVIDLRETTPFVHDEVGLVSALQAGADRTILLGDRSRDEEAWREHFNGIAHSLGCEPVDVTVLRVPADEELGGEAFRRDLAAVFGRIPDEPIVVSPEALAFVEERVAEPQWDTPWRETPFARLVLIFLPLQVLGFLFPPELVMPIVKLFGLIFYPFYFLCLARLATNAVRQKRLGVPPRPGLVAIALSPMPVLMLGIIIGIVPPLLAKARSSAQNTASLMQLRAIEMALMEYEAEYGRLPGPPGAFDSTSPRGEMFLRIMVGDPSGRLANPGGVVFLDPGEFRRPASGAGFVDRSGRPIRIVIGASDGSAVRYEAGGGERTLRGGSPGGAVGPGPDGELGTRDDQLSPMLK